MLDTQTRSWQDSEAACVQRGPGCHLASIHSAEEHALLQSMVSSTTWIGLSDAAREGTWVWSDGTAVDYTNWTLDEPNNGGHGSNQDCGNLWSDREYTWDDGVCSKPSHSLCSCSTTSTIPESTRTAVVRAPGDAALHTNFSVFTKACNSFGCSNAAASASTDPLSVSNAGVANTPCVVFAPANRSSLQAALFGCVGACGGSLSGSSDETYCNNNGHWTLGTGANCDADSTHGAIDTWDVSRVTSMRNSEW